MADPLADLSNVQFLDRHACHWGDFGHVRATIKGLRAVVASNRPFDYVVLLTGQDYPLKSSAEIAATLRASGGKVYMRCDQIPNENWDNGGMDRIENWHFHIGGRSLSFPGTPFPRAWMNTAWSWPARSFRIRRTFPAGIQPYGGSSYWIMPAQCAGYVDAFVRDNPDFVSFFKYVHVPDEIFFHTIVMNSSFSDLVVTDNPHYVDWSKGESHPKVLTTEDFEKLMQSEKLFARKFDPEVDIRILERIDQRITQGFSE